VVTARLIRPAALLFKREHLAYQRAMSTDPRKTALVTGASSGIGKAFAEQLAERGYDLVLTARRSDRLNALADALRSQRNVRAEVITADLADPHAPDALIDAVSARGLHVDLLVNNAGYGIPERFVETTWAQQAELLQVLVSSVAHLTHLVLPSMIERGFGRVINIASLAGLVYGAPGSTLYAGAKSFLIKMSESLSLELADTGVAVTAVCPGFTMSEFHDVNGMRERVTKLPSLMWMDAQTVAREGIDAALEGKAVYVNGAVNKVIASAMRHMPSSLARQVIRRQARNFRHV
jgi:short-subunit dehydrogenase